MSVKSENGTPNANDNKTLRLWSGDAPLAKGSKPEDVPEITIHLAPAGIANGSAILVCPGGGYGALMMTYEGHDIAKWLNGMGVAGIVLKYRLAPYRHPAPLLDAQRALRTVRLHAKEWGLDPKRLGALGFSAGGHLVSTLGTHFDAGDAKAADPVEHQSCRPDFMALVYPVVTMGIKTNGGTKLNLLGENPDPKLARLLSNETQVTKRTPPCFLAHSIQDEAASVANSDLFYDALKEKGVDAEYLKLPTGKHGLGCGNGPEWEQWQNACKNWLAARKIANAK